MSNNANQKWFADNGNNTYAITFPLNENSKVIDFGGYKGVWAQQIIEKYNPNMYLLEPIPFYYNFLLDKFKNNPKVIIKQLGISNNNKELNLYFNEDGSSAYIKNGPEINISCVTPENLLKELNIDNIDLAQINIEGEEYDLLDHMFKTNIIKKFSNIQIQFHDFIENSQERRENIQNKFIENNFEKIYDYPFVFEAWRKK